jgi:hypothetical protein
MEMSAGERQVNFRSYPEDNLRLYDQTHLDLNIVAS